MSEDKNKTAFIEEEIETDEKPSFPKDADSEVSGKINILLRDMMDTDASTMGEDKIKSIIQFLSEQYKKGYRHSYYNISAEIYSYWENSEHKIDNLSEHMKRIRMEAYSSETDEIVLKGFDKLYDHIMLEIVRLRDNYKTLNNLSASLESSRTQMEESKEAVGKTIEKAKKLKVRVRKTKKKAKKANKKIKNVYSQFISMLGIFTAIVIVFFGGTTIFSNVMVNIHLAKWYEVGVGVALVGLILFNIIFMFLFVVAKYIDVIISVKKHTDKKWKIAKWMDKYPYVFIFNILCIVLAIVCIVASYLD